MALSTISTISSHMMIPSQISSPLQMVRQIVQSFGSNVSWHSSCISSDGTKLYGACAFLDGYFHTFNNSTSSWEKVNILSPTTPSAMNLTVSRGWRFMACDETGTKIIACMQDNHVYTTTNSGINWVQVGAYPINPTQAVSWQCASCDRTFTKLYACSTAGLYKSINGGAWQTAVAGGFRCVSVSKNGENVIAITTGQVSVSYDGGNTWSTVTTVTSAVGPTCCIDNNGLAHVGLQNGVVRRLEKNATTTTVVINTVQTYYACACSADGSRIIFVSDSNSGDVFISTDSGATWTNYRPQIWAQFGSLVGWKTVAITEDGTKFILGQGNNNGNIIIGTLA